MSRLYIVGIGPGERAQMTPKAVEAINSSEVLCGYPVYLKLIEDLIREQKVVATPMRQEKKRCEIALREAVAGHVTAMVCSGDPGVYGMASLIFEMRESLGAGQVEIQVIAGITAANSAAAELGAPLNHDYAVISLSDLLTPWEVIEKRLALAAEADFVIALYNPSSRKRAGYLKRACEIILRYRDEGTLCGYVRNIARDGQETNILTLGELQNETVDMFTTVIIGSSNTRQLDGWMVTPRGYVL